MGGAWLEFKPLNYSNVNQNLSIVFGRNGKVNNKCMPTFYNLVYIFNYKYFGPK
jgi:hypothetical protein